MPQDLTLGAPSSCFTDQTCTFSVSGNVTAFRVLLVLRNLQSGISLGITQNFPSGRNLATAPVFFDIKLNDFLSSAPLILPVVCGDGVGIQVQAFVTDPSGHNSPNLTTTFVKSPCICTKIDNVFTTLDALSGCVGIDGTIGIQGKLFEVTCTGGTPSPLVNQGPVVHIGLVDPATGTFYEYVLASTDPNGTFSVGFGIKNRTDVAALIPANDKKAFNLAAFFDGDTIIHSRSPVFTRPVTVSGNQGPQCPLGTLILDQTFATAPPGETLHQITGSYTGKILALSDHDRAVDVMNKVRDAIVSAGATPIEIKVFRGPDISLPAFFGFGAVSAPAFNVVATAVGSPVAIAVIAAAIIAIIIILAIFVIALWFIDTIVSKPGGAAALIAVAVGVTAVAGVGLYILTRPRARRLLA